MLPPGSFKVRCRSAWPLTDASTSSVTSVLIVPSAPATVSICATVPITIASAARARVRSLTPTKVVACAGPANMASTASGASDLLAAAGMRAPAAGERCAAEQPGCQAPQEPARHGSAGFPAAVARRDERVARVAVRRRQLSAARNRRREERRHAPRPREVRERGLEPRERFGRQRAGGERPELPLELGRRQETLGVAARMLDVRLERRPAAERDPDPARPGAREGGVEAAGQAPADPQGGEGGGRGRGSGEAGGEQTGPEGRAPGPENPAGANAAGGRPAHAAQPVWKRLVQEPSARNSIEPAAWLPAMPSEAAIAAASSPSTAPAAAAAPKAPQVAVR